MTTTGLDPGVESKIAFMMGAIGLFVIGIFIVFLALRLLWWIRRRGFRPTYGALGHAFQELQGMGVPQIHYMLEAEQEEGSKANEDDDEGGPDDPTGRKAPAAS